MIVITWGAWLSNRWLVAYSLYILIYLVVKTD
jgi:hypothetical protein